MPATPITDPVSGESLVGTEPQLQQQVDPGWWRQRLNLFTGRALSVSALDSEQNYRGGLLGTLGQSVTAGTVSGLVLTMDLSGADPLLVVSPGYGITANGEDVVLNSTLKTRLSTLAVIDPVTGNEMFNFHQSVGDPTNSTYAGILVLQPVVAQVSGQTLDTGMGPIEVSGNLNASCDQDPAEYAFEDWQIADAVRLVYLPWPAGVPALPLPPLAPEATWRNRLAYQIFEAEALLGPDDQLPWAMLGLPVALIAFNPGVAWAADTAFAVGQFITDANSNLQQVQTAGTTGGTQPAAWNTTYGGVTTDGGVPWINIGLAWQPLFVDCPAVVRAGGLPRNRYVLPAQPPPLLQWQSNMPFQVDDFILDGRNNVQVVQTAGTTGGPPPNWNATFGQTTTDGTVTWINNGPGSWQPNTAFAAGQFLYDSNNNMQHVLVPGTSASATPDWNGIYLPTIDGTITWVNNGSGTPPIVQPALAQARINQLSEQLSQVMTQQLPFTTLADIFATLPPSGILPAAALNFTNQTAPWFPPNWTISAAPVHMEELETVLETGMTMDLIAAEGSAPTDPTLFEPVEVLVPLPDAVYDPDILVQEVVAPIFQQEVDRATQARNLTLRRIETVQQELNTLFTVVGPNTPVNPNLIDLDAGLTPDELQGRDAPPPYTAAPSEIFGTVLQSTWQPSTKYAKGQFVIDGNGAIQVALDAASSGSVSPGWNTNVEGTTTDGLIWVNRGNAPWQANQQFSVGQIILDSNGDIEAVTRGGISGASVPTAWGAAGATTADNSVIWTNLGKSAWAAAAYAIGQAIIDSNGNIQLVLVGGVSSEEPTWNVTANATTPDGCVTWMNNSPWNWQPNTAYIPGQFIVDTNGYIQTVLAGGSSASSPPAWPQSPETPEQQTPDGIVWQANVDALWQPDFLYSVGQVILDSNQNAQIVQTAGISGDAPPPWNPNANQGTQDSGVTWNNLGHFLWQAGTNYSAKARLLSIPMEISRSRRLAGSLRVPPSPPGKTPRTRPRWMRPLLGPAAAPLSWQPGEVYFAGQIILWTATVVFRAPYSTSTAIL